MLKGGIKYVLDCDKTVQEKKSFVAPEEIDDQRWPQEGLFLVSDHRPLCTDFRMTWSSI